MAQFVIIQNREKQFSGAKNRTLRAGRRGVRNKKVVAVPATAKRGGVKGMLVRMHGQNARGTQNTGWKPVPQFKPRPQVAGLTNGGGGIWLRMGGDFEIFDLRLWVII